MLEYNAISDPKQCGVPVRQEGGIRVAGLLEWPARIRARRETDVPAYVNDYLPTFLDVAGIPQGWIWTDEKWTPVACLSKRSYLMWA